MSTTTTPTTASTGTVRRWHTATLGLVALIMGLEFAHVLELGPKLGYPPELYLQLNLSLYRWFGGPVGGGIYVGSILAAGVLTWLVRRQRAAVVRAGSAGVAQATAFVSWLAFVEPVNMRFRALAPGEIPLDLAELRVWWELTHAAGFVLFATAFLLLHRLTVTDPRRP